MDLMLSAFAAGVLVNAGYTVYLLSRVKWNEQRVNEIAAHIQLTHELHEYLVKFSTAASKELDLIQNTLETLVSTDESGSTDTE